METDIYITVAYTITGVLLTLLILSTWTRARKIRAQLAQRDRHEA